MLPESPVVNWHIPLCAHTSVWLIEQTLIGTYLSSGGGSRRQLAVIEDSSRCLVTERWPASGLVNTASLGVTSRESHMA